MPSIAFATYEARPDIDPDDRPLVEHLEELGYQCVGTPWNGNIDWSKFDGVIIRSTWDYHRSPSAFRSWIEQLEANGRLLWNPAPTLIWNMHKGYLLELEKSGIAIIPTCLMRAGESVEITGLMAERGWNRAVLKPAISLGGNDTAVISGNDAAAGQELAGRILAERDLLIQRFQPQIESQGEWSLIFIDGKFSHAVLKRPPAGEFRAQDHLGATFEMLRPPPSLLEAASLALERCGRQWIYARVDGVIEEGQFLLMELELLEPTLFLADNPHAAERLAKRIDADVKRYRLEIA